MIPLDPGRPCTCYPGLADGQGRRRRFASRALNAKEIIHVGQVSGRFVESGTEVFVPLNKLKKFPRNTRKTPHSEAAIGAYAASIAAKSILQNLVVEPELDAEGWPPGSIL